MTANIERLASAFVTAEKRVQLAQTPGRSQGDYELAACARDVRAVILSRALVRHIARTSPALARRAGRRR